MQKTETDMTRHEEKSQWEERKIKMGRKTDMKMYETGQWQERKMKLGRKRPTARMKRRKAVQ
jgi:hypothetical protein